MTGRAIAPGELRLPERLADPRLRHACALAAGAGSVFGFSPFDLLPVVFLCFALLVFLWVTAKTPRSAFLSGYLYGLGFFGAGVSWVYVSLARFGGMPPVLAGIATLGFCAGLALFPALVGWLQARFRVSVPVRATLVVPALWALGEWLRTWFLTGFPWLGLGYAAIDSPLAGYAPVAGVHLVSLAMALGAGLAVCVLLNRAPMACGVALVLLFGLGGALRGFEWTRPSGAPARVELLQGNIGQDLKFDPARYAQTLETYAALAERSQAQLIVFPETAVPRFLDLVEPAYLERLAAIARKNSGDLLLGVPTRQGAREYYNSVVTLGVSPPQAYHKSHLVPFGEFVPPGFGWIVGVLSIPLSDFSRGRLDQAPLRAAGQRIAVNICYEDVFGADIIRQLPEATLLVNVSNVAWFGDSLAPAQHLQIARMRARETGRMVLTAANTGITAAIDRDGRVLGRLPQFRPGRLELQALGYTGATPYVRVGDRAALLLAVLMLGAARVLPYGSRPSQRR